MRKPQVSIIIFWEGLWSILIVIQAFVGDTNQVDLTGYKKLRGSIKLIKESSVEAIEST